ncbi:unnamed protein product [Amaranthus hypochondriacus]
MTMVPAPKLSKPLHFFNGGCGGASSDMIMTRFTDGNKSLGDGFVHQGFNNNKINGVNNFVLESDLGNSNQNNNNNLVFMAEEEEHSRTSNTSVNDAAAITPAIASSSPIRSSRDETSNLSPYSDHHDNHDSWLQLGLGVPTTTHLKTGGGNGGGGGGAGGSGSSLMLELNLGSGTHGGISIHETMSLESRSVIPQRPLDFVCPPQHSMFPVLPSFLQSQILPPQTLSSTNDYNNQQLNWGYVNQRTLAAGGGCSSLSPSSSSSMPSLQPGQACGGSFLTRPFTPAGSSVDAADSEYRLIYPPPRRPHSGIWFTLQASFPQSQEPFLPQVSKSFLRIKDGRMTIGIVKKYLANKLGLDSESEVEIRCRGHELLPFLTLQHVRDNIWSPREGGVTLLPDSSTSDHLMVLNYARSSTYLLTTST